MKLLLFAVCLLVAQVASAEVMTWTVDGQVRRAIVYAPTAASPGGKVPLVFSFHGRGDDMQNFQHTNLHQSWPEAVLVYVDGLPGRGGLQGWQVVRGEEGDRDLKLVDAALASLRQKFPVDEDRVYATGFSNGAAFTYLLWAERPGVFAAFATVAGRIRPSVRPAEPRPVYIVAGRSDRTVPFTEQQEAIKVARDANGTAAPVTVWTHEGGHQWPAGTSTRIASFFREHRRAAAHR